MSNLGFNEAQTNRPARVDNQQQCGFASVLTTRLLKIHSDCVTNGAFLVILVIRELLKSHKNSFAGCHVPVAIFRSCISGRR